MARNKELEETQEALVETYSWLQEWYGRFQQQTGLTPSTISSRFNLRDRLILSDNLTINTERGRGVYGIYNLDSEVPTEFGPSARIRIAKASPLSTPKGDPEGMMVLTPVGDYTKAKGMSVGWVHGESDIIYMGVYASGQKILRMVQTTAPDVLFKAPTAELWHDDQAFQVDFRYVKHSLVEWVAQLYPERKKEEVLEEAFMKISSNKMRVVVGKKRHSYKFPQSIDMARTVRNIIEQKPALMA